MTDSSIPAPSVVPPTQPSVVSAKQRRLALTMIVLNNLLIVLGYQLWRALFNNFAIDHIGVRADQIGLIQSIREVPGLLGFAVGMVALVMSEMRIAGLSVILLGIGILTTGGAQNLTGLLASTLVMSVGFHFFMPSNSSALLQLAGEEEAPRLLGRLNSLGALIALVSAGIVFLTLDALGFRTLFTITGAVLIVAGLVLLPWNRRTDRSARTKQRTPIRRQYWLYYVLEFLMGSRRHIFTTFAVFLLVREHQVSAQTVALLFAVNNLLGTFLFSQFGKIVVRFGERRVLTFNFACITVVFLGYAYISWLPALYLLFVADHVLFGFRIAVEAYFQKIALFPHEITPNLSLGMTINHIAAVIIPVVGGVVWETLGGRYTFLIGVAIVVVSLVLVQWVRTERASVPDLATAH
jgi:predicted MFS family arabinose efflux permease